MHKKTAPPLAELYKLVFWMKQGDYYRNIEIQAQERAAAKELKEQCAKEAATQKAHTLQLEEEQRQYRRREERRARLTLILLTLTFLLSLFSVIWQIPLH